MVGPVEKYVLEKIKKEIEVKGYASDSEVEKFVQG